jgi:Arc/MetJ-type ribon-helix-helix transcriptional regulator
MTIELPRDLENSILAKVHSGLFPSMDAAMIEAARLLLEQIERNQARLQAPPPSPDDSAPMDKPIWERILERTADIPEEEWDKLPTDLAEQHDHYLYGTPKRPTA